MAFLRDTARRRAALPRDVFRWLRDVCEMYAGGHLVEFNDETVYNNSVTVPQAGVETESPAEGGNGKDRK